MSAKLLLIPIPVGEAFDVHRDINLGLAAAQNHALEGTDVSEVPAVGDGDVPLPWDTVVGRVEVDPPVLADGGISRMDLDPGVGGIGADQPGAAGGAGRFPNSR